MHLMHIVVKMLYPHLDAYHILEYIDTFMYLLYKQDYN